MLLVHISQARRQGGALGEYAPPNEWRSFNCEYLTRIVNYKARFDSVSFHFVGKRSTFCYKPPLHFLPTGLFYILSKPVLVNKDE